MVGLKSVISGANPDVNVPVVEGDYGADWSDLVLPTITIAIPCFRLGYNTIFFVCWCFFVIVFSILFI